MTTPCSQQLFCNSGTLTCPSSNCSSCTCTGGPFPYIYYELPYTLYVTNPGAASGITPPSSGAFVSGMTPASGQNTKYQLAPTPTMTSAPISGLLQFTFHLVSSINNDPTGIIQSGDILTISVSMPGSSTSTVLSQCCRSGGVVVPCWPGSPDSQCSTAVPYQFEIQLLNSPSNLLLSEGEPFVLYTPPTSESTSTWSMQYEIYETSTSTGVWYFANNASPVTLFSLANASGQLDSNVVTPVAQCPWGSGAGCLPGQICVNGACADPSTNCPTPCASGQVCVNGTCMNTCDGSAPCPANTQCQSGICGSMCSPACSSSTICVNGTCVEKCDTSSQTPCSVPYAVCTNGACLCANGAPPQNGVCPNPCTGVTCPSGASCTGAGICICTATGTQPVNGVCPSCDSSTCSGGTCTNGNCVCPGGVAPVNGVCPTNTCNASNCVGGQCTNNTCVCPSGTTLVNGTCTAPAAAPTSNTVVILAGLAIAAIVAGGIYWIIRSRRKAKALDAQKQK